MTELQRPCPTIDRRRFLGASARALAIGGLLRARPAFAEAAPLRVLVWCEGTAPPSVYPDDIDGALADHLGRQPGLVVARGRLTGADSGLSDAALDAADVIVWWGRLRHDDVPDDRAEAVAARVRDGNLGLVALHGSCSSKPFCRVMGGACEPGAWREDGRPEHVGIATPDHPIARGVGPFTIPRSDMFAEPLHVPEPEAVVLVSTWDDGATSRTGLTWEIDSGRVAYLRTGLDAFPVLYHPSVRKLLANAVSWVGRQE